MSDADREWKRLLDDANKCCLASSSGVGELPHREVHQLMADFALDKLQAQAAAIEAAIARVEAGLNTTRWELHYSDDDDKSTSEAFNEGHAAAIAKIRGALQEATK